MNRGSRFEFQTRNTKDMKTKLLVIVIPHRMLDLLPRPDKERCTNCPRYFGIVHRSIFHSKSTRANVRAEIQVPCSRDLKSVVLCGVSYPCRIEMGRDNVHGK